MSRILEALRQLEGRGAFPGLNQPSPAEPPLPAAPIERADVVETRFDAAVETALPPYCEIPEAAQEPAEVEPAAGPADPWWMRPPSGSTSEGTAEVDEAFKLLEQIELELLEDALASRVYPPFETQASADEQEATLAQPEIIEVTVEATVEQPDEMDEQAVAVEVISEQPDAFEEELVDVEVIVELLDIDLPEIDLPDSELLESELPAAAIEASGSDAPCTLLELPPELSAEPSPPLIAKFPVDEPTEFGEAPSHDDEQDEANWRSLISEVHTIPIDWQETAEFSHDEPSPGELAHDHPSAVFTLRLDPRLSHAYRALAETLTEQLAGDASRIVLFAHASRREDENFSAVELAAALASIHEGDEILLVDALDQGVHGNPKAFTFVDVIEETVPWAAAIAATSQEGVSVVQRGLTDPQDVAMPAEELWADVRGRFRWILVNAGPVKGILTRHLAASCHATYLTLSLARTRRRHAAQSLAKLRTAGAHVAGTLVIE